MNAKEEKCVVVENRGIGKDYYLMKLESGYIAAHARPGNFIMVAASRTTEPLLKRPFGILSVEGSCVLIYYEVVGKGTRLISGLRPGDAVNVLGPLGNSFPPLHAENILMVAGGRGIAPVYYAITNYTSDSSNKVFLLYGARSGKDLNLLDRIEALPLRKTFLYTEDGSMGQKGLLTADIASIIQEHGIGVTISCGPEAMFEALSHTLKGLGTKNHVSMEALMGCGFGICHSCVVKGVDDNYKKVCTDGPVFVMEEIAWET
jgi:dihydroorotate dehydrogenase electron transfer subunit